VHGGQIQMIDSTSIRAYQQAATAKRWVQIIVSVEAEAATIFKTRAQPPNIPAKSTRKEKFCFSKQNYRECNRVERFFSELKHFRRVATRYDKLAGNSSLWSNSLQYASGCAIMSLRPIATLADFKRLGAFGIPELRFA
jgi:transposase